MVEFSPALKKEIIKNRKPIWIIWQHEKEHITIRAICTSEEIADIYVKMVYDEARLLGDKKITVESEETILNHLFGFSTMIKLRRT